MAQFKGSLTLVDAYTRKKFKEVVIEAADWAAAMTELGAFVVAYQAVTDLHLIESRLFDSALHAGSPVAGANVDTGGTFSVALVTPNKYAAVKVPGIKPSFINVDGTIDLTDAAIIAWMSHYTAGSILISDGEVVDTFVSGMLDK